MITKKVLPTGWEDPSDRKNLADRLARDIDAYDASMQDRSDQWQRAQDVYDEALVLSSLTFIDGVDPYNVALMPQRIDGVVEAVCGPIANSEPYFVVKGRGASGEHLDDIEKTLHYALDQAGFDRRIRESGYMAALRGRGMLRLRYETLSEPHLDRDVPVDSMAQGSESQVRYSGLIIDVFKPEDCVVYPTYSESIPEAVIVGHRFIQSRGDAIAKQHSGRYFTDISLPISAENLPNQSQSVIADSEQDGGLLCYDLLVKTIPPNQSDIKRYRVTLLKQTREILAMEDYDLPTPWYFSPAFRYDINSFWNRRSLADRLLEVQTIYNDAYTLIVLCAAASSFTNVAVTNYQGEAQTQKTGIGKFTLFKGNPSFFPIPSQARADILQFVIQSMEHVADSLARISKAGLGMEFRSGATATEVQNVVAGQAAGINEFTANFAVELQRMADFARFVLADNWTAFKQFHGDAVPVNRANEMRARCRIELSGKSGGNTPQALIQKIQMLLGSAKQLGISASPGETRVNADALFSAIVNALDLNISTSRIVEDDHSQPAANSCPPTANSTVGPEVLLQLLQRARGAISGASMDPGMPPAGAGP